MLDSIACSNAFSLVLVLCKFFQKNDNKKNNINNNKITQWNQNEYSPTLKSNDSLCQFDETINEIMDITIVVTQIDSLESTIQLMLAQINHMANMQTHALRKMTTNILDIEFMEARIDAQEMSTKALLVGPARWQLKDPKPPKFNGNAIAHSTEAIEQWISNWDQCFQLCCIIDNEIKL